MYFTCAVRGCALRQESVPCIGALSCKVCGRGQLRFFVRYDGCRRNTYFKGEDGKIRLHRTYPALIAAFERNK